MRINFFFLGTRRIGMATAFAFAAAMIIALLLFGLQAANPAHAASTTFTVNSTGDAPDATASGDGTCQTATAGTTGECTLRAAIQEANATTDKDTITFNIPSTDTGCNTTSGVCTINVGSSTTASG